MNNSSKIFAFGSNLAGIHGAGAARFACHRHGAQMGTAVGRTGSSYAIPTKGLCKDGVKFSVGGTLELRVIAKFVDDFVLYALRHPELIFQVTCIGCGLAGLRHEDVAPMFQHTPDNCWFDELWRPHLPRSITNYWGTF